MLSFLHLTPSTLLTVLVALTATSTSHNIFASASASALASRNTSPHPFVFPLSLSLSHSPRAQEVATSIEYTADKSFKNAVLNVTNTFRRLHNASAVTWNETSAEFAKKWGDACVFEHSGGPTGENLASGYPNATSSLTAWFEERASYDYAKAQFSKETGHFTQLVWKSTASIGCSRTLCSSRATKIPAPGWFLVCEYYPPGNIIGAFKQNVQRPLKQSELPPLPPAAASSSGSAGASKTAGAEPTLVTTNVGPTGSAGGNAGGGKEGHCPYPGQECSAGMRVRLGMGWVLGLVIGALSVWL